MVMHMRQKKGRDWNHWIIEQTSYERGWRLMESLEWMRRTYDDEMYVTLINVNKEE